MSGYPEPTREAPTKSVRSIALQILCSSKQHSCTKSDNELMCCGVSKAVNWAATTSALKPKKKRTFRRVWLMCRVAILAIACDSEIERLASLIKLHETGSLLKRGVGIVFTCMLSLLIKLAPNAVSLSISLPQAVVQQQLVRMFHTPLHTTCYISLTGHTPHV